MTEIVEKIKALGVKPISELQRNAKETLYAVVQYAKPVTKSRGIDYVMVMNVADPSVGWDTRLVSINMFYPEPAAFPSIINEGDIVIFTNMRVSMYQGTKKQLLVDKPTSQWAVVHRTTLKVRESPHEKTRYILTEDDTKVVELLSNWYREVTGKTDMELEEDEPEACMGNDNNAVDEMDPPIIQNDSRNRYILPTNKISDIYRFFDYIGMVIAYDIQMDNRAVLLLTDYTENPRPMDGYITDGTIDPKLIIQGTLWDEHARGSIELGLQFGDIVYIRNLQAKTSKESVLELSLRGEKNAPTGFGKCKIKKLSDLNHPYVRAIRLRKERFEKHQNPTSNTNHVVDLSKTISIVSDRIKANTSSIRSVLNDNELVQKYKIRAKIIDFKPHEVDGWFRKWCRKCESTYPVTQAICESCQIVLENSFKGALRCEDAEDNTLVLIIHGEDSLTLFNDLPPAPLTPSNRKSLLNRLARICPGKSNADVYFDLGVKSYVVPMRGRRYRITDTRFQFM